MEKDEEGGEQKKKRTDHAICLIFLKSMKEAIFCSLGAHRR